MDAERPCPIHQNREATHICLSAQCAGPQIFCQLCEANHNSHQVSPFDSFQKKYEEFQSINDKGFDHIKNMFKRIKDTFTMCINKAEQIVLRQYLPSRSSRKLPKLSQIQSQQIIGIIGQLTKSIKFKSFIKGDIQSHNIQAQLDQDFNSASIFTDQLSANLMSNINKFTSQIKFTKQAKNPKPLNPSSNNYFRFSQKYKSPLFHITNNQLTISRTSNLHDGLSMYAVMDEPFTQDHSYISFKLESQKQRFIYYGVCDKQTFKAFGFKGHLYAKGNKMWAIRQSGYPGRNAVTLHNSIQQYSNKQKVPYDFKEGDIITIRYSQQNNSICFIKNGKQKFDLPLDKSISKFYPFVGLKFKGDQVRIVDQDQVPENKEKKMGGLMSFFKSSIK